MVTKADLDKAVADLTAKIDGTIQHTDLSIQHVDDRLERHVALAMEDSKLHTNTLV
jgi:hypothetical protein